MTTLDFPYTCPAIDKQLEGLKDSLSQWLEDVKNTVEEDVHYDHQFFVDCMYSEISEMFEELRVLNDHMRTQAEKQFKELDDEIGSLEDQVEDLERENSDLVLQISSLQFGLYGLR